MISHHCCAVSCASPTRRVSSVRRSTHRAAEGEEGLDHLVLREEGMPSHQVDESAQSTSPAFDEFTLRDGGQDCVVVKYGKKK